MTEIKKRNIMNLCKDFSANDLLTAGLMSAYCNQNTDNIDVCEKAVKELRKNFVFSKYFEQNAYKDEVSVKERLKQYVGKDNSWLCYFLMRYLTYKGYESYIYNDKNTGKFICLLLDEETKKRLNIYFENIEIFNSTKENSKNLDVHSFSLPFIKSSGINCLTNLEIIDFFRNISTNTPKVESFILSDELDFDNDQDLVDFFETEIIKCSPLICLVGPSGCGKTSIATCLETKGLTSVASYTTRKPRYDGEQGHTFITQEEFMRLRPDMISETYFSDNYYGITTKLLDKSDIFVVDPAGVKELKKRYSKRPIVVIVYDCPEDICKKRMQGRGDTEKSVNARLINDREVFKNYKELADVIVPAEKDFPNVLKETLRIIKSINNKENK